MINHIRIVSIPVADQQAAKDFYTKVLGFQLIADNPMGPDRQWVQVGPEGAQTSFTLVTWFNSMRPGSLAGVVLETDDVDAEHKALKARGLEISSIETQPWGRFATFADPDGNGFVLQQSQQ